MPSFVRANAPWLGAGVLLTFSSSYGQTFFISIFAAEIQGEFGLGHGAWGSVYGLGTLAAAGAMVWAGALTDRYRVRALGSATLLLLSVACLSMAFVPGLWALPIAILLLRFAGQGMPGHIATVAMARWFVANRGKALSIAFLGFSLGEAVLPITFVSLLGVLPWRTLWVLAGCFAILGIPVLRGLLRHERTPQSVAANEQSPGLNGKHWTRSEALRHPLFWCMIPMILGPPAFVTALFFHQVHLSAVKGWPHVGFVALFPLYTAGVVCATLLFGWLTDRFGPGRLMPILQVPLVAGFLLMSAAGSLAAGALAMLLIAFMVGASHTVQAAFWAEYFGTRHIGAIRAVATALMVLGTAIGPTLTGGLIDAGITFDRQLPFLACYFVLTSFLIGWGIWRVRGDLPTRRVDATS